MAGGAAPDRAGGSQCPVLLVRRSPTSPKSRLFWPILIAVVIADRATKRAAVAALSPALVPHDIIGNTVRFTLSYNPAAVFGLSLGPWSRIALIVITLVILAILLRMYAQAAARDRVLAVALGLLCGGALGNLLDRILSPTGVVDFIDVGVGAVRFWTFNVADSGITVGAILLAIVLWRTTGQAPRGESEPGRRE
ncbi:MAG TPA: signal peptidase II [Gemmatimonadaceae bacterium]|nr:signal peptidase II [Gemmatimonadaceae bacterium]